MKHPISRWFRVCWAWSLDLHKDLSLWGKKKLGASPCTNLFCITLSFGLQFFFILLCICALSYAPSSNFCLKHHAGVTGDFSFLGQVIVQTIVCWEWSSKCSCKLCWLTHGGCHMKISYVPKVGWEGETRGETTMSWRLFDRFLKILRELVAGGTVLFFGVFFLF